MQVIPVPGPSATASTNATPGGDARERAIAALMGNQPQAKPQTPPVNQNNIAPEETGAIRANTQTESPSQETKGQDITSTTETAAEPPKKPEEALSSQYAQLARKEKALYAKAQSQEASFKAREAALQAKEQELAAKEAKYTQEYISKASLAEDPFQALVDAGVSYDQVTQRALESQTLDPIAKAKINALEARLAAIQKAQETQAKAQEQAQAQAYQQAIKQLHAEASHLVNNNPDFETIKSTGSVKEVVSLIEKTYKEDGYVMDVETAAKAVEDYMQEEIARLANLSSIQKRIKPQSTTSAAAPKSQEQQPLKQSQPVQQMKTLTNQVASSRQLSARERALLAFKGEKV